MVVVVVVVVRVRGVWVAVGGDLVIDRVDFPRSVM